MGLKVKYTGDRPEQLPLGYREYDVEEIEDRRKQEYSTGKGVIIMEKGIGGLVTVRDEKHHDKKPDILGGASIMGIHMNILEHPRDKVVIKPKSNMNIGNHESLEIKEGDKKPKDIGEYKNSGREEYEIESKNFEVLVGANDYYSFRVCKL